MKKDFIDYLIAFAPTVMNPMSPNYDSEKEAKIIEQIVDEMKKSNPDQTNPEQGISRVDITAKEN